MSLQILQPPGWLPPIGYANGISVAAGRIVFIAGQVGWDANQRFQSVAAPGTGRRMLSRSIRGVSDRCAPDLVSVASRQSCRPDISNNILCRPDALRSPSPRFTAAW
jgi:hypothetical protein